MHAEQAIRSAAESIPAEDFTGVEVAIWPLPALGDLTIYLRLGWLFHRAGANVTFYSNVLYSAREYFNWSAVHPEGDDTLAAMAKRFDLLIVYRRQDKNTTWGSVVPENVAFVAAKQISHDPGLNGQGVTVKGRVFPGASRAFCLDPCVAGTMVDWVDRYARDVFGLELDTVDGFLTPRQHAVSADLVLIFPTTPEPKKNYWLPGFRLLARMLQRRGWQVEFVCTPAERSAIAASFPGHTVRSFPDIKALMDHIARATTVISNDSGGGHLGSMMGLMTYTITRRKKEFVWRPGFNKSNTVIYPWFRFKWLGKYVWRPFVPVWQIANQMGSHRQVMRHPAVENRPR